MTVSTRASCSLFHQTTLCLIWINSILRSAELPKRPLGLTRHPIRTGKCLTATFSPGEGRRSVSRLSLPASDVLVRDVAFAPDSTGASDRPERSRNDRQLFSDPPLR